jgi:hypothetical protein
MGQGLNSRSWIKALKGKRPLIRPNCRLGYYIEMDPKK